MKRQAYCFNCGADLGIVDVWPGDILSCGEIECNREEQAAHRERDEDARERAGQDQYDRYRY